ncbi:hypothetical protein [Streptomyces sp. NPDC050856]|uniref:hypothetical protein n=1 Tax=Streptomyces sp. NPDC050856 TaxID=3154939 RepID=UPI0033F109E2
MGPCGPQIGDDMVVDLALSVLTAAGVPHLLVRDADGRCAGLVTQAQLMTAHRARPSGDSWYTDLTRLRDIVHDRGPFLSPVTSLRDAEPAMRGRAQWASPVVDDEGYALGVLVLSG